MYTESKSKHIHISLARLNQKDNNTNSLHANIHMYVATTVNGTYIVTTDFDSYQRDGKSYWKVKKTDISYELGHGTFKFDNLFNGNKQLGMLSTFIHCTNIMTRMYVYALVQVMK